MSSDRPAAQDSASSLPFDLVKELSSGASASTWLARTRGDGSSTGDTRLTEVLRLGSQVTDKPDLKAAALRDVAVAQKLKHPNVIAVSEAVSAGKDLFIPTDLAEGEPLSTLITSSGLEGLGTDVTLRIGLDVLEALAAAHALSPDPLVHGELTPQQILVGPDGTARVSGFGIARTLSKVDPSKNPTRMSYAAPERAKAASGPAAAKDTAPLDPRSDLFSTAIILWEGIAKQKLFAAKMDAAVIQKVLTATIAPLTSFPKIQVSPLADAAILKALERDPARRFQNAADFIAALQKVGPAAIASREKVAATVERLAGRSIATRRAQLATALSAPAIALTAASPSDAASAGAPLPGKRQALGTLLGMPQMSPAQILAAAREREKTAAEKPAAAAPSPANEAAKMSKAMPGEEIVDEATVDGDWSESDEEAAPKAPALKPPGPPPPIAAKPAAPTAPTAPKPGVPAPAAKPSVAPPAAPKAPVAAAPSPGAATAPKPAAPAAPAMPPKAAAAPAPPAAPAAAADKAGAKARFQVALPPASGRPAAKSAGTGEDDSSANAKAEAGIDVSVDEAAPAAAAPAATAGAPRAPGIARATPIPAKPTPAAKPADEAPKASAIPKPPAPAPAPAPGRPGTLKPMPVVAKPQGPAGASVAPKPAAPAPGPAARPPPARPQAAASQPVEVTAVPASTTPVSDAGESSDAGRPSVPGRARAEALDKVRPGSTLGRYEILMPVARGGMASVWAARLQGTRGFQKIVAVKTMLPDVSDDPEFESMFLDEARIAARIRHPNVVEIYDLGEQDDVLYIVMEWIDGETLTTLQKAAKTMGGIPLPILLRLASQVCAGLHSAHELRDDGGALIDLIHRDISPGNVLLSSSGFVKVADFGIAKSKGRLHVTRGAGVLKGKTPYLSPEQLRGMTIDRRSDLFSLGTLLYVMTTGLHPFRAETEAKTMENIALLKALPLREVVPNVHPEWEKIILKALEKDRAHRFATAGEMQKSIDNLASSIGVPTTDEDVAAFVQKAIGDALKDRARNLRAAIAAADGPGVASTPSPQIAAAAPPAGATDAASGAKEEEAPVAAAAATATGAAEPVEGAAAAPPFEDITIDEEVPEEPAKEASASAPPAPRDGALVVPIPAASKPGDINAPKVMLSPDVANKPPAEAPSKWASDAAAGGALLGPAGDPLKPGLAAPGDVAAGAVQALSDGSSSTPGTSSDGSFGDKSLAADDENPFARKKRGKLVPIAAASALVIGIVVGGLALSGAKPKPGASVSPERTGSNAAASMTAAATEAPATAPAPADSVAAAPSAEAAPSATAEVAPAASVAPTTPEPVAEPSAEPTAEPAAVPEPAPTTPRVATAPQGGSRPIARPVTTAVRPTPTRPTPTKPGPTKGGTKPPTKYNPSGI